MRRKRTPEEEKAFKEKRAAAARETRAKDKTTLTQAQLKASMKFRADQERIRRWRQKLHKKQLANFLEEKERLEKENGWILDFAKSRLSHKENRYLLKRYDIETLRFDIESGTFWIDLKCQCGKRRPVQFLNPIDSGLDATTDTDDFRQKASPVETDDSSDDFVDKRSSLEVGAKGEHYPEMRYSVGIKEFLGVKWGETVDPNDYRPLRPRIYKLWAMPLKEISKCESCLIKEHAQIVPGSVRYLWKFDGLHEEVCEVRCPKCNYTGFTIPVSHIKEYEAEGLLPPDTCLACQSKELFDFTTLEMHGADNGMNVYVVTFATCKKCDKTKCLTHISEIKLCECMLPKIETNETIQTRKRKSASVAKTPGTKISFRVPNSTLMFDASMLPAHQAKSGLYRTIYNSAGEPWFSVRVKGVDFIEDPHHRDPNLRRKKRKRQS